MSAEHSVAPRKPRIALVVQRYGTEVVGGAESHCRSYAESLLERYDVDVLTSCALDYSSWANHYPPGATLLHGVRVIRFASSTNRHPNLDRWWGRWARRPRNVHDEVHWVYDQGPILPEFLAFVAAHRDDYELVLFFTYLYFPTAFGLPLLADKAVFVPTANPGEAPLTFSIYRDLFRVPRAIIYCTDEERDHCHQQFGNDQVPHEVLGVGFRTLVSEDPGCFRRQLGLDGPYLLFLGRIGPSKGCDTLLNDYLQILGTRRDHHLVFAGTLEMELPHHPRIHHAGVIAGALKDDALCGATAILAPSTYDCLSIMTCEAWAARRPVLVTARSPVVSSLCERSGGGAIYHDAQDLGRLIGRLIDDPQWADDLGRHGHDFLLRNYGAEDVEARLLALLDRIRGVERVPFAADETAESSLLNRGSALD